MTLKPEDLKPCPFCASPGRTTYMGLAANRWAVGCSSPGCFVLTCDFEAEPDAIAAWNRRPDPRPSPVGREEVARWICRTVRIAQGFKGTAEYTLDDEVHNAWDDWLDEADDLLALFSPADGWRPLSAAAPPPPGGQG